jgi:polar amino acid transport system substrate-binding protein
MNRRQSMLVILVSCLVLLTACSTTKDDRLGSSVEQLDLTPAPATSSSSSSSAACRKDYKASLRPDRPLPAPNKMSPDSFMDAIWRQGYLMVGVDQNTKLLGYYNPNKKQFEGFDIDIAQEIAKAIFGPDLHGRIRYRALLTSQRTDAVRNKQVDIVADAVTINCPRTRLVSFSNVYFMAHQRVLVRSASQAQAPGDLRGKKVCATTGSTAIETMLPGVRPYPVSARTDCLVALQQADVDAILADDAILYGFLAQDPHTKLLPGNITDEPYGLAIDKSHPEFVRFVNAVLEQMRGPNGRWTQIWKRWFGSGQVGGQSTKVPVQPPPCYTDEKC